MDRRTPRVVDGPPIEGSQGEYATLMDEYLVNGTRLDITSLVSALSSYTHTQLCWDASMQVMRYLHDTWNYGITYGTSSAGLHG